MKTYKILFLTLTISFGIQSCYSGEEISKVMQSWVGYHYSDMMLKWGLPTYSASDGKGGMILVYQYNRDGHIPGYVNKIGNTVFYQAPRNYSYTAERMFYVDTKGLIYSWRWQGI